VQRKEEEICFQKMSKKLGKKRRPSRIIDAQNQHANVAPDMSFGARLVRNAATVPAEAQSDHRTTDARLRPTTIQPATQQQPALWCQLHSDAHSSQMLTRRIGLVDWGGPHGCPKTYDNENHDAQLDKTTPC